jgi:hypothetical protein
MKFLLTVSLTLFLASGSALGVEKKKAKEKPRKPEVGASCKAPADGAACSITCPPGETATCSPGVMLSNVCHTQPACKCGR